MNKKKTSVDSSAKKLTHSEEALAKLRDKIDDLDVQIQELISQRVAVAHEVAKVKLAAGGDVSFYRPEREAQVFAESENEIKGH